MNKTNKVNKAILHIAISELGSLCLALPTKKGFCRIWLDRKWWKFLVGGLGDMASQARKEGQTSCVEAATELAEKIEYIELANEMDFQMFFAEAMLFE